jgi:hypothetical protein
MMEQWRKNLIWVEQENAKRRKLGMKLIRAGELEHWRGGLVLAVVLAALLMLLDRWVG